MDNLKRMAAAVMWLAIFPCSAHVEPSACRSAYEELRDAVYDYEPLPRVEDLFLGAAAAVEEQDLGPRDRLFWLSRLEYLMGRAYQVREDKKRAALHFEAGLECAQSTVESEEFSDGWRMMAENLGQLCLVKDLPFLVANGMKAVKYAQRALKADPRNVAARIYLAASKVYPPPVAGGNPAQGVEQLKQALELGPAEKDDLFNIYSGIGIGLGKLRRKGEAAEWLRKALELYPNNTYARQELAKVGG